MVVVVVGIVGLSTYAVVMVCWAREMTEGGVYGPLGIAICTLFAIMSSLLLWSYFATVLTDPGTVPPGWQPYSERGPESSRGASSERAAGVTPRPLGARWCKRCLKWKPDRCHHCSVCGRCVLKMDHHCVWVINCVGGANYKFFLLFLFYTCLTSVFSTIVMLPYVVSVFGYDDSKHDLTHGEAAAVFVATVFDVAFAFSVAGFLAMHLTLVLSNTTTIEMYEKKRLLPWRYDLGRRKNFEQVFGAKVWHWLLPMHFEDDKHLVDAACGLVDNGAVSLLNGNNRQSHDSSGADTPSTEGGQGAMREPPTHSNTNGSVTI